MKAWNSPYVGEHAEYFVSRITEMYKRDCVYCNTVAIIQSSGTGKSRLVDEAARLIFIIPVNLMLEDLRGVVFPPSDCSVRDFLLHYRSSEMAYLCLFRNMFEVIDEVVQTTEELSACLGQDSFPSKWRAFLLRDDNRKALYDRVVQRTRDALRSSSDAGSTEVADSGERVSAMQSCRTALQALIKTLRGALNDRPIKAVISFDDFQVLSYASRQHEEALFAYDILLRIFEDCRDLGIFGWFLSTDPRAILFKPPPDVENTNEVLTKLPFDSFVTPVAEDVKVEELCTLSHLASFGRPLWMATLNAASNLGERSEAEDALLRFVAEKLLRCSRFEDNDDDELSNTTTQNTTIFDTRLQILYEVRLPWLKDSNRLSRAIQVKMIASHLRNFRSMVVSSQSLDKIDSGSPSEPIVAEACALQWLSLRKEGKRLQTILGTLNDHSERHILDWIDRRELGARLLLTLGYDETIIKEKQLDCIPVQDLEKRVNFSVGCSVNAFFQSLFTEEYSTLILQSVPDTTGSDKFEDSFKDSIVRFTHFSRLEDGDQYTSPAHLYDGFIRCDAWINYLGDDYYDLAIPILLDRHRPVSPSNMTTILVQIRRLVVSKRRDFTAEDICLFDSADDPTRPRPYVNLSLVLGVEGEFRKPGNGAHVQIGEIKDPDSTTSCHSTESLDTDMEEDVDIPEPLYHSRYNIHAYGSSAKCFKVLTEFKLDSTLKTKESVNYEVDFRALVGYDAISNGFPPDSPEWRQVVLGKSASSDQHRGCKLCHS